MDTPLTVNTPIFGIPIPPGDTGVVGNVAAPGVLTTALVCVRCCGEC
ncbi:hypothetical protein [Candidatus Methylacidiphilum infernorum]|nr:hypothetical protein [Candidatus Methylacidiphilum infernorum]